MIMIEIYACIYDGFWHRNRAFFRVAIVYVTKKIERFFLSLILRSNEKACRKAKFVKYKNNYTHNNRYDVKRIKLFRITLTHVHCIR